MISNLLDRCFFFFFRPKSLRRDQHCIRGRARLLFAPQIIKILNFRVVSIIFMKNEYLHEFRCSEISKRRKPPKILQANVPLGSFDKTIPDALLCGTVGLSNRLSGPEFLNSSGLGTGPSEAIQIFSSPQVRRSPFTRSVRWWSRELIHSGPIPVD